MEIAILQDPQSGGYQEAKACFERRKDNEAEPEWGSMELAILKSPYRGSYEEAKANFERRKASEAARAVREFEENPALVRRLLEYEKNTAEQKAKAGHELS